MINKVLTTVAVSAFSLTMLAACGSGGGNNNNGGSNNGPKISITVIPNVSRQPGTYTPTSCTGMTESSLCAIQLKWTNLQVPTNNTHLNQLSSTLNHGDWEFDSSTVECSVEMNESPNGSCLINYDFNGSVESYESAPIFTVVYSSESNTTVATSNPIIVKATSSVTK